MKLKDIIAGTRAIHRVRLPLVNVPSGDAEALPELSAQRARDQAAAPQGQAAFSADHMEVGLRVLLGIETQEVLKRAQDYAERNGSKRAGPGDPLYDFGFRIYTLALAAVDPDSDPKNPVPFFGEPGNIESAVDEMLASPHIGRDGILYLSEQHEFWQDMLNPQRLKLTLEQLWAKVGEVAASKDARPLLELQPATRWIFMRFMAVQLLSSLDPRSSSTASSLSERSPSTETASS